VRVAGRSVDDIPRSVEDGRPSGPLAHAAERLGGAALPDIQEAVPFTVMLVQDIVADVGTRDVSQRSSGPHVLPLGESVVHKPHKGRLLLFRHPLEPG
jgi:hypothetical protein